MFFFLCVVLFSFSQISNWDTTSTTGTYTYNGDLSSKQDCADVVVGPCKNLVVTISKSSNVVPVDGKQSFVCNVFFEDSSTRDLKDITETVDYIWEVIDPKLMPPSNVIGLKTNKDIEVPYTGTDVDFGSLSGSSWVPGKEYVLRCTATVDGQSVQIERVVKKESFMKDYPEVYDKSPYKTTITDNWNSLYDISDKVFKEIKVEVTSKSINVLRDLKSSGSDYNLQNWELFDFSGLSTVNTDGAITGCSSNNCRVSDLEISDNSLRQDEKKLLLRTSLQATSLDANAKDAEEYALLWFYKKKPDIMPPEILPKDVKLGTGKSHKLDLSNSKYEPADNLLDTSVVFEAHCTKDTPQDCDTKIRCDDTEKACWFNDKKEDLTDGAYTLTYRVCNFDKSVCTEDKTIVYNVDSTATDPVDVKKNWDGRYVSKNGKLQLRVDDSALSATARRQLNDCEWKINDVVKDPPVDKPCTSYKCRWIDIDANTDLTDGKNDIEVKWGNSVTKFEVYKKGELERGEIAYDVGANFITHNVDGLKKKYRFGFVDKSNGRRQNSDALWKDLKISLTDEKDEKGGRVTFPPIKENDLWINTRDINEEKEEYEEKPFDTTLSDSEYLPPCTKLDCNIDKYDFLQKQYYDSYAPYCEKCQIIRNLYDQKDKFIKEQDDYEFVKASINLLYRSAYATALVNRRDVNFKEPLPPNCIDADPNSDTPDTTRIDEVKALIDELIKRLENTCLGVNVKCPTTDINEIDVLMEELRKLCVQFGDYRAEEIKKLIHLWMMRKEIDPPEYTDIIGEDNSFIKPVVSDEEEKCLATNAVSFTDEYCFKLDDGTYTGKVSLYQKETDLSTEESNEKKKEFEIFTEDDVDTPQVIKKMTATFTWDDIETDEKKIRYECRVNSEKVDICQPPTLSAEALTITCVCEIDKEKDPNTDTISEIVVTEFTVKDDGKPGDNTGKPGALTGGEVAGIIGWVAGAVGGVVLLALLVGVIVAIVGGVLYVRNQKKDDTEVELEKV